MKLKKEHFKKEVNYPDYEKHEFIGIKSIRNLAMGFSVIGIAAFGCSTSKTTEPDSTPPKLPNNSTMSTMGTKSVTPIYDSDKDGIPDNIDKCPAKPEDKDNFKDEDGCPDPDNDQDGIADVNDKCPNRPETKNGFRDNDGCPDNRNRPPLPGGIRPVRPNPPPLKPTP